MSKKEQEGRSTAYGSRLNPRFPMLYETHRVMYFDQDKQSDAFKAGWDRIFGKKSPEEKDHVWTSSDHALGERRGCSKCGCRAFEVSWDSDCPA